MDRRAQRLLVTRVSVALVAVATLSLIHLLRHASTSCFPLALGPTPSLTSCDAASRRVVPPDRRLAKLRVSPRWRCRTAALKSYAFPPLQSLGFLAPPSRVLCLAAGAGHAVDALRAAGVGDVTGIDLVDFPPLVRRADPHRLPFAGGAFDLVFSDDPAALAGSLFPSRLAAVASRSRSTGRSRPLRRMSPWTALFKRSRVVDVKDVTLDGSQVRLLILQSNGTTSILH